MVHDILWFWATGRFDPAWVEAATDVALMFLTTLALLALLFYALDNHRLAAASEATLTFLKDQQENTIIGSYADAFESFQVVQGSLKSLMRALLNETLVKSKPPAMCPANWSQLSVAIALKATAATGAWIAVGISLRRLDFEVTDYLNAPTEKESMVRYADLRRALDNAIEKCKQLAAVLPEYNQLKH